MPTRILTLLDLAAKLAGALALACFIAALILSL